MRGRQNRACTGKNRPEILKKRGGMADPDV
jgi:hypothetical protein